MVIIGSTDKNKQGERERSMAPEAGVLTSKIINFEQGRKALEKDALGKSRVV